MVGSIKVEVFSGELNGKIEPLPEDFDLTEVIAEDVPPVVENEASMNGEGEEKQCKEIVLGRNVHTMCLAVMEPDADDEVTGDMDAYMASVLARYWKSLIEKKTKHHLDLFILESRPRTVPVPCNSTSNNARKEFCVNFWDACQNVSISKSPFAPSVQGSSGVPVNSTSSKMTDFWKSKGEFCNVVGGTSSDGSVCFNGEPASLNNTQTPHPPSSLCLELIGNRSYLNMVAHLDGFNRIFLFDQQGKIWLATVPVERSGETLRLNELNPFLDLTDEVHYSIDFGLMGIAFHPNFSSNGRFFVSFNCDKVQHPRCSGRCSCNLDANCDPSKLISDNGARPC